MSPAARLGSMKRNLRRVLVVVLLAVALYGAFALLAGYREIGDSLEGYGWWSLALALALATANYGLRFAKWQYYLSLLDVRGVRRSDSLLVFLAGFTLTVTPGKVGEVLRSVLLQTTYGIPVARTAPIVVADRLTDAIGVIVLVVLGVGLILWRTPALALVRWFERRPNPLRKLARDVEAALQSLYTVASPRALLWPAVLAAVAWACEAVALYAVLYGFGTPVSMSLAVFFYSTAMLAGGIVPLPGGLGVAEPIMQEGLIQVAGIARAPATAAMVLTRLATLWWAVLLGFVALTRLKARYPGLGLDDEPGLEVDAPSAGKEVQAGEQHGEEAP
jgi:uncharacterized membrane protein YbhN (UPF0104 family)